MYITSLLHKGKCPAQLTSQAMNYPTTFHANRRSSIRNGLAEAASGETACYHGKMGLSSLVSGLKGVRRSPNSGHSKKTRRMEEQVERISWSNTPNPLLAL